MEKMLEKIRKDLGDDQRFKEKLKWIEEMAEKYAHVLGITPEDFLLKCEENRSYWSANYYQPANFPPLGDGKVYVFETMEDVVKVIDYTKGFICPSCNHITSDENVCTECRYSLYGLITLDHKTIVVKERVLKGLGINKIFIPVCWLPDNENAAVFVVDEIPFKKSN